MGRLLLEGNRMASLSTYAKITALAKSEDVEILASSLDESSWVLLGVEEQVDATILWFSLPGNASMNNSHLKGLTDYLTDLAEKMGLPMLFESSSEQERNWNEQWEAAIEPFQWGSFWITPPWSDQKPPQDTLPIVIHPKMSFGTGTHETTQLMLSMLESMDLKGAHGVDAGTGTGILSVAAILLGADSMLGFDVDHWAVNNATETFQSNGVAKHCRALQGGFECLEHADSCDLMIANIHTRVLLDGAQALVEACNPGGSLLLSGLLVRDESVVIQRYQSLGCTLRASSQQNDWSALHFECPTK
jgi:ribosomal protein L11 methyltransferase